MSKPKPNPSDARPDSPPELPALKDIAALPAPGSFLEAARSLGVEFEGEELARLGRFLGMLLETNTRFNLTAIRSADEAWERHILDALGLVQFLADVEEGSRVADVGSGGGVPGLPLAIVFPGLRFTLIEATGKKARFLEAAAEALGLTNVRVTQERAEVLGHDREGHRGQYDAVLARAVGHLAVVAELCAPLAKVGGLLLMTKGQKAEEELGEAKQALHMLHLSAAGVVETPTGRIVALEKRRETPRTYPRRPGEPARAPLGLRQSDARARDES
ncbi:MAG: 16S rRNA (guanine(527)-N(7))-methyltransferase RsmG [Phycisphaerales bacterium]